MKTLGINIYHPDSSAVLIVDNEIIAAVEEERFTKVKHSSGFPFNSINFCLNYGNINFQDLDLISVNYNKYYNIDKKFFFFLKNIFKINFFNKFKDLKKKNSFSDILFEKYQSSANLKIKFVPHHISHIASSFFCSGFDEAVGLSFDATGDFSTTESFIMKNNKIKLIDKINFPHSLGIFYQSITQYLGFREYGDEYKVMGLSGYGKPNYENEIKKLFSKINDNGDYLLNLEYFNHHYTGFKYNFSEGEKIIFADLFSNKLEDLLGKKRGESEKIDTKHMDIASSAQKVFEDIVFKKLNFLYKKYKIENLCLAGGCAFNSLLNGKIKDNTNFKNIFIQPNSGDAGGALGSALYSNSKEKYFDNKKLSNICLGPQYTNDYIEKILSKYKKNFFYKKFLSREELNKIIAKYIYDSKVVGWFQGRMEYGPRALGNRSILGNPINPKMKDIINLKIKLREEFRPFAPSILVEKANEYFYMQDFEIPFMNYVVKVKPITLTKAPSIVHVDNTSRVQTVSKKENNNFYDLINEFYKLSNIPILLNTSLNVHGPISENPDDAINCFMKTSMDVLVIEDWVLTKNNAI